MILNPIAEYYSSRVLSEHDTEKQAQHMVRQLRVEGFQPGQIEIIAPDTDQMGDKLEPEQNNIARTAA
ncbi:MAG: hypothetical protein R3208_22870, partial [Ketobacteraceae bacterium]|nr:hypothetical protein [Ketobacteraceae bacterium]